MDGREVQIEGGFFGSLVSKLLDGWPDAERDLAEYFSRGLSLLIRFHLGDDFNVDPLRQRIIQDAIAGIRRGEVDTPQRLPGYVRRVAGAHLTSAQEQRCTEPIALNHERAEAWILTSNPSSKSSHAARLMRRAMEPLTEAEKAALRRFWVDGQSEQQIHDEIGISATELRQIKAELQVRFSALVDRSQRRPVKRELRLSNLSQSGARSRGRTPNGKAHRATA